MVLEDILERVNRASLNFLAPLTPDQTYSTVVKEAIKLVDARYCSLILKEGGEFKRVYSTLPKAHEIKFRKKGFTYKAFQERHAFVIPAEDVKRKYPKEITLDIQANIYIPLSYKAEAIGVLILNLPRRENLTPKELNVLELFGSMVTLAIRKTQLYDETKQALQTRDLFISMAAHELRTPLTSVNGYAQLLQTKLKSVDSVEKRWSQELVFECKRLTYLANELLTLNLIKSGQLSFAFRECYFSEIVEKVITNLQFIHPHRRIHYNWKLTKEEAVIIGDFDKLVQAVVNLVENAIKYSLPASEIIINLESKCKYILLQIADKGIGIPRKDMPKIFERFYQGVAKQEGLGVGLFLAKYIITSHKGNIRIHSVLGKGTTVKVSLPKVKI